MIPRVSSFVVLLASIISLCLAGTAAWGDENDPPPGYYDSATSTGAVLKSQLRSIMTSGHIQRRYGDFRQSAVIHDADPAQPGNIILGYDNFSIPGQWDSGASWNREHVWPQSRQPGSASNSTRGNLGDPHALLPMNPSTNGSRGNKPFGLASTTGSNRGVGAYYFPGDADKGDVARMCFYSDTRWSSLGLSLVNGFPSGNQMGDLTALLAWHYLDPPDTFERRRNHAIFAPSINPVSFTNNRNAYVDMPEAVWSIYVDQQNDSRLWLGDSPDADGSSSRTIQVNTIAGVSPGPINATLHKDGDDGTFYEVSASEGLDPSVSGRSNAFPIGSDGVTRGISIEIDPTLVTTPGFSTETLVVDNLDLTTQGGPGRGANDGDDTLTLDLGVYEPFNASLEPGSDTDTVSIDLGTIGVGAGDAFASVDLYNIAIGAPVAPMDASVLIATGDTGVISLLDVDEATVITPGDPATAIASMSDDAEGAFSATYTLQFVPTGALFDGMPISETIVVQLSGEVAAGSCPADVVPPFGEVGFGDLNAFVTAFAEGDPLADVTGDGTIGFEDVNAFAASFAAGCP